MDMLTTSPADTIALALGLTFAPLAVIAAVLSYFGLRSSLPTTLA